MSKYFTLLIIFTFVIAMFSFSKPTSAAIETKYVSCGDSKLNVKKDKNKTSATIGQLRNGKKVKVLGESSDWAKITYSNKTGYVPTKNLKNKLPSYLKNTNKTYYYNNGVWGEIYKTSYNKSTKLWEDTLDETVFFKYKEFEYGTKHVKVIVDSAINGFDFTGDYSELPRNMYKGMKIYDYKKKYVGKVITVNKTLKVRAGTFKNVVQVKEKYGISYYAPNIGLIKTDTEELVEIE
ncbi:SH3 domain-containing protein [Rummeliibacillus pycnus]|uniref:SH3 domain-containing protein n=1 Tax=Rummeliibacillus pycnus TaxID=101070 RepID=UPI0037CA21E7